MHSGSHLLRKEILKDFKDLPFRKVEVGVHYQKGGHFIDIVMDDYDRYFKMASFIISPMRHPARILASFKARGRPIIAEDEPTNAYEKEGANFEAQWKNLIKMHNKYPIIYIHIDDIENRDNQVKELSELLDIQLQTDWPIDKDQSGAIKGTHNLEVTEEMIKEVPDWIMDFYNKIKGCQFKEELVTYD